MEDFDDESVINPAQVLALMRVLLPQAEAPTVDPSTHDTTLVEACCTLWDLSTDPAVAQFMCAHHLVPLVARLVATAEDHSDRLAEVCVGLLGNLASNAATCAELRHAAVLPALERLLYASADSLTLLELFRLISAGVSTLALAIGSEGRNQGGDEGGDGALAVWLSCFGSESACSRILHVMLNTLRPDLMRMAASLLGTLLFHGGPTTAATVHGSGCLHQLSEHIASLWHSSTQPADSLDPGLLHELLTLLVALVDTLPPGALSQTQPQPTPAEPLAPLGSPTAGQLLPAPPSFDEQCGEHGVGSAGSGSGGIQCSEQGSTPDPSDPIRTDPTTADPTNPGSVQSVLPSSGPTPSGPSPADQPPSAQIPCPIQPVGAHEVWRLLGEVVVAGELACGCAACETIALLVDSAALPELRTVVGGPWWIDGQLLGGILRLLRWDPQTVVGQRAAVVGRGVRGRQEWVRVAAGLGPRCGRETVGLHQAGRLMQDKGLGWMMGLRNPLADQAD